MIYSIGTTGYIRSLRDLKKILDELSKWDDDVSIEVIWENTIDLDVNRTWTIRIRLI